MLYAVTEYAFVCCKIVWLLRCKLAEFCCLFTVFRWRYGHFDVTLAMLWGTIQLSRPEGAYHTMSA